MTKRNFSGTVAATIAAAGLLASATASAVTFTTPDFGLPTFSGTGLQGSIWNPVKNPGCPTSAPCAVADRNLGNASNYMNSNTPDAVFVATAVDYPNGSPDVVPDLTTRVGAFLGSPDAGTLQPNIGSNVLFSQTGPDNFGTLLRFSGYYRVDTPGIVPFNIGSDDGSDIRIQGQQVALNDGIRPFQFLSGPVNVEFTKAGLYKLQIDWFDGEPVQAGIAFGTKSGPDFSVIGKSLLYVSPVPEPATGALLVLGFAGLWNSLRKKR